MDNPIQVLYAMSAKICHDIATPVNAIGLGLEMLEGRTDPETYGLVNQSTKQATFKINFYRMLLSPSSETPSLQEGARLLQTFAKSHHVELDFNCNDWWEQNGSAARFIVGMIYICMEGMTRGGRIKIMQQDSKNLVIDAMGDPLQLRPLYLEIIQGSLHDDSLSPKTVFMHYLMFLAQSCHFDIKVESGGKNHLRFCIIKG